MALQEARRFGFYSQKGAGKEAEAGAKGSALAQEESRGPSACCQLGAFQRPGQPRSVRAAACPCLTPRNQAERHQYRTSLPICGVGQCNFP